MNIALIGARGAGKTKSSRRLSVLLRRAVVGTDAIFAYETGQSIAGFIRKNGGGPAAWRKFREQEYQILKKACRLKDVILDCGGGIVVDLDRAGREKFSARKVRLLRKHAMVVWLRADPDRIAKKIARDPRRPALGVGADPAGIMRRRAPFYRRAAHVVVDVGKAKAKKIAARVLRKLDPYMDEHAI